jgi:hypothetical protein
MYKPGSQPEYSTALGAMAQPVWNDAKQSWEMQRVLGDTPEEQSKYQLKTYKENYTAAKEMLPDHRPEDWDYLAYTLGGIKPPAKSAYRSIPGPAGLPQNPSGDGKTWVRPMYDPSTNQNVEVPIQDYKPPEPKPGVHMPGIANGRNVVAFFNPGKKTWQDAAGTPLPDFQPFPSYSQTGMYDPAEAYNPATQAIQMGSFNRRTGKLSFPDAAGPVVLDSTMRATIGKEFGNAREAQTRLKIMQQNAVDAYQGNQQAMVSLLMNHIGMTLGAQKGTRVAKSIIDEARQSTDWVDSKLSTIGHQDANGDFIYDGLKGGINLAGGQIKQMVDLAKQRNDLQWQQVKDTGNTYGVDLSGAIAQTQGAEPQAAGKGGAGGGGGQFVVIDPNNKPHRFDTQAQANQFRNLIKPKQ